MTSDFSPALSELLNSAAGTPLPTSVSTWSFISEISGETTTADAGAHDRRRLKAERLSAAGRQHDDRVAAGEHGVHRFLLQRTEGGVAPVTGNGLLEAGDGHVGQHYA